MLTGGEGDGDIQEKKKYILVSEEDIMWCYGHLIKLQSREMMYVMSVPSRRSSFSSYCTYNPSDLCLITPHNGALS
jgi:hypothetical protein